MTFPEEILTPETVIWVDGAWVDITDRVYGRQGGGVTITHGIQNEGGSETDPARADFELDNRDGRFTTKNPASPYYGKIGRGTRVRHSVLESTTYLHVPGAGQAETPDNAALDITGDLDMRIEFALESDIVQHGQINGISTTWTDLFGKYASGNRSYLLWFFQGNLELRWSEDGNTDKVATATEYFPFQPGRRYAVRATLDVNNGSSGHTVTFYTSDSITGSWTQLGDPVVGSGTTSIFNGTAAVKASDGSTFTVRTPEIKIYKAELRNGIGGTVVANPDFTVQTPGASSFADAAGRTWSMTGGSEITNRNVRFLGNIISWPVRWQTGSLDAHITVEAVGPQRRFRDGAALQSAMRREFTNPARTGIIEYWPMEDGTEATSMASALPGRFPMLYSGDVSLSSHTTYGPSLPVPEFNAGTASGLVSAYTDTGELSMKTFVQLPTTPPSGERTLLALECTGTILKWVIRTNSSSQLNLQWYDRDEVLVGQTGFGTYFGAGVPTSIVLEVSQDGADIDYALIVQDCRGDTQYITALAVAGTVTGRTLGKAYRCRVGAGSDLSGAAVGHLALANDLTAYFSTGSAMKGWKREDALSRVIRVARENEVDVRAFPGQWPVIDRDYRMGNQGELTLLGLIRECEESANGLLYEDRETGALVLRDGTALYAQDNRFTIDYEGDDGLVEPLDPEEDDQGLVNDMTVQQISGSTFQYQKTSGPLNINYPEDDPEGVGPYEASRDIDVFRAEQAEQFARWYVHVGTWDEWRYPRVTIYLQNAPHMIEAVTRAVPGDVFEIDNMPDFAPPGTAKQMILGSTEFISQYQWEVTFNCRPARPFSSGKVGSFRADTAGSVLNAAIDEDDTTLYVRTTSGPEWIDSASYSSMFPFDITIGGERMTVTAIAPPNTDAFGRTVANGWGTSDSGLSWSTAGGTAADYAVGSGYGSAVLATTNASRRTFYTWTQANAGAVADVTTSATATGASIYGGLTLRYASGDDLYMARLEFSTANAVTLSIRKRVAAAETQLATYSVPGTHTPGTTFWRLRFEVVGSTVRARAWLSTALEPGGWHVSVTDTDLTTSSFAGTRSISATGNTNVNPAVRYDNYTLYLPQQFTVTRSVEGVIKSHAAGAPVSLSDPTYAGL